MAAPKLDRKPSIYQNPPGMAQAAPSGTSWKHKFIVQTQCPACHVIGLESTLEPMKTQNIFHCNNCDAFYKRWANRAFTAYILILLMVWFVSMNSFSFSSDPFLFFCSLSLLCSLGIFSAAKLFTLLGLVPYRFEEIAKVTAKEDGNNVQKQKRSSRRYLVIIFVLVVILNLVQTFCFSLSRIKGFSLFPAVPPESMVLINKMIYRSSEPMRGDIVQFMHPKTSDIRVCRIIGMPGDRIKIRNKVVYVNDAPLSLLPLEEERAVPSDYKVMLETMKERIKDPVFASEDLFGNQHIVIHDKSNIITENYGEITTPPGHYFLLGDNRDISNDSRFWGFLSRSLIQGKVMSILSASGRRPL